MAIRITPSGRTILTGQDYEQHRRESWERQKRKCADCGNPITLAQMHFHHYRGRGGGKRDDMDPRNKGLCGRCHGKRHP